MHSPDDLLTKTRNNNKKEIEQENKTNFVIYANCLQVALKNIFSFDWIFCCLFDIVAFDMVFRDQFYLYIKGCCKSLEEIKTNDEPDFYLIIKCHYCFP